MVVNAFASFDVVRIAEVDKTSTINNNVSFLKKYLGGSQELDHYLPSFANVALNIHAIFSWSSIRPVRKSCVPMS